MTIISNKKLNFLNDRGFYMKALSQEFIDQALKLPIKDDHYNASLIMILDQIIINNSHKIEDRMNAIKKLHEIRKIDFDKNWISLDYAGWEGVNFLDMKWRFDQNDNQEPDYRDIKRKDNGQWLIQTNSNSFTIYSNQGENGPDDSDQLEELFQDFIKKNSLEFKPL